MALRVGGGREAFFPGERFRNSASFILAQGERATPRGSLWGHPHSTQRGQIRSTAMFSRLIDKNSIHPKMLFHRQSGVFGV